jgi:uncharacterized protein (DUF1778 family)
MVGANGTVTRRRGRPTRPDARRTKVGFRVNAEEQQRIERLARMNGQTLSEFVREAVIEAASDCSDEEVFDRGVDGHRRSL